VVFELRHEVTIIHPFHPRYSQKFTLLSYGRPRGSIETVILLDDKQTTVSLPLSWTDAYEPDAFAVKASGRSWFRTGDLVRLAALVKEMMQEKKDRKEM